MGNLFKSDVKMIFPLDFNIFLRLDGNSSLNDNDRSLNANRLLGEAGWTEILFAYESLMDRNSKFDLHSFLFDSYDFFGCNLNQIQ